MPKVPMNYANTIIYKLCCNDVNITDIYVGHTTNFTQRKRRHKCNCCYDGNEHYNIYVYKYIREKGGWDDWSMVVIEKYPCVDKNEAEKRERYWIELLQAKLNKYIPTRNKREYYEDNKEKISENKKQYREDNKEKISENKKQYYKNNKEKISENKKQYYEDNKEKIIQKASEKFNCPCGGKYTFGHKFHHSKTKIHQDYINNAPR
jgi:hypothetical protein